MFLDKRGFYNDKVCSHIFSPKYYLKIMQKYNNF